MRVRGLQSRKMPWPASPLVPGNEPWAGGPAEGRTAHLLCVAGRLAEAEGQGSRGLRKSNAGRDCLYPLGKAVQGWLVLGATQ